MRSSLLQSVAALLKGCGLLLLGTCVLAVTAHAQTQITAGTIQGTVTDQAGAVVPGATVEVKNLETNQVRTLTTDEDGRFVALQLSPGHYTVSVSKSGFATLVQEDFPLTVGETVPLNLSMKVSQVVETITINAVPTIDTLKTESSTTLNDRAVSNIPVLGRKFEDLLTLTPGVSITQGPDGDEINFAGQRGVFNNVSLDGGDYNNGFFGEQAGGQRAAIDITLEAVQEFQVVATGASAEFGRTAGGVVNVITKSGTNELHGSAFYFQRLKALAAHTSDNQPLTGFHREQFGGTLGGPIKKDRVFFFGAFEQIRENLTRPNLSVPLGTPCPVSAPTILANEALINSSTDCQRLALLGFFRATRNQEEGAPVKRPIRNSAALGKLDWTLTPANKLGVSYNFDYSRNTNQTFDVATYGNSANGIEGPSKIHALNVNLFSTLTPNEVNELHFTYGREVRPRAAVSSNVPADTAMGFATTFRFGSPFFLQPNVDELIWRTQLKDNLSIVSGRHTFKVGGDWLHTLNDQVFRGFFTGRYIFDSVAGFLRYTAPTAPGGFGPTVAECIAANGAVTWVTRPAQTCPAGTNVAGPLLLYLQDGTPTGISGVPPPGKSTITNQDYALFAQDKWQLRPNFTLNYGLRWEAQIFPDPIIPPSKTAYGALLNDPRFPSDGTLHSPKKEFQPRVGFAWDISNQGQSVLRASYGIFYGRQNMLSQVGSITTNGAQQFGVTCASTFAFTCFGAATQPPTWPNTIPSTPTGAIPFGASVRVFSRDYANPRIYTTNAQFEQEIANNLSLYFDYTHAQGVHLTRFLNYARKGLFPQLGDIFVTSAVGKSLYNGFTAGMRRRFSRHYQFEANYVLSKDKDDDSNERDPFTDRAFDINNLQLDYALSDRDIRHRFNFYMYAELPWGLQFNPRVQARSAQPITPVVRTATNRNTLRKDNKYFSFDWRLARPFQLSERVTLMPSFELFNTFNNANNVNPLSTPGLFNFDGFLRQGVGDPRQAQLAVKLLF
jgi:outer membrane receptor protein involved in Fe transport